MLIKCVHYSKKESFQKYSLSHPHDKPVIERLIKFSLGNYSIDEATC